MRVFKGTLCLWHLSWIMAPNADALSAKEMSCFAFAIICCPGDWGTLKERAGVKEDIYLTLWQHMRRIVFSGCENMGGFHRRSLIQSQNSKLLHKRRCAPSQQINWLVKVINFTDSGPWTNRRDEGAHVWLCQTQTLRLFNHSVN